MARIEELTKEAVKLPLAQRLALARTLLDLEPVGQLAENEQSWDEEILNQNIAVDEGRVTGITIDDLRREMNSRYGA